MFLAPGEVELPNHWLKGLPVLEDVAQVVAPVGAQFHRFLQGRPRALPPVGFGQKQDASRLPNPDKSRAKRLAKIW